MKRILPFFVAMLATAPALAAGPVSVTDANVPAVFSKEPAYMQNQICAELLVGMARMSIGLYIQTGVVGAKEAAVVVGTRALTFQKANASMSDDEKKRAKDLAEQIEKNVTPENPGTVSYQFCEARAQRWMKEGVVSADEVRENEAAVRAALDTVTPLKSKP
jgi:hypothetical protein